MNKGVVVVVVVKVVVVSGGGESGDCDEESGTDNEDGDTYDHGHDHDEYVQHDTNDFKQKRRDVASPLHRKRKKSTQLVIPILNPIHHHTHPPCRSHKPQHMNSRQCSSRRYIKSTIYRQSTTQQTTTFDKTITDINNGQNQLCQRSFLLTVSFVAANVNSRSIAPPETFPV